MMQSKYKLIIAYDGTSYSGWQIQPNALSIQQEMQDNLKIFMREDVHLVGAGRTDTGVHALGQTAHFQFHEEIDERRFLASANGLLPGDIRILTIEKVKPDFHAQYSAKGKIYHYFLCLDRIQNPFRRLYSYQVHEKINVELLNQAAALFVGTHDFTSFANSAHEGSASRDAVRTIFRLSIVDEGGGYLRLEFEGDGFLYKMVRNIVGTILEVASGKINIEEIPRIFEAKDRKLAGKAAPPHGLFLIQVRY